MMDKFLIDKDLIARIEMYVKEGCEQNRFIFAEFDGEYEYEKEIFKKGWFGDKQIPTKFKKLYKRGWYKVNDNDIPNYSQIYTEQSINSYYDGEAIIKDNKVFTRSRLRVYIYYKNDIKQSIFDFYFDTLDELKERMEVIQSKFKNLVAL